MSWTNALLQQVLNDRHTATPNPTVTASSPLTVGCWLLRAGLATHVTGQLEPQRQTPLPLARAKQKMPTTLGQLVQVPLWFPALSVHHQSWL
mmetsp:Transcript_19264/g.53342  ORF Transcript_19264/g.53342 Transcript_19264/m.53342 type:complete len:92 (+) Transcript_19264:5598-5873(+)